MINICFRVDGSKTIGMGHIMRCLSLAEAFKDYAVKTIFISMYEEGILKIRSSGYDVLDSIDGQYFDVLIVDSYDVTFEYFEKIRAFTEKLIYIDDINTFTYPVDILINGNITGIYMNYEVGTNNEVMLLGMEYNLIREEFKNLPGRIVNKEVKEIMLTTGGADFHKVSSLILEILSKDAECRNLRINVVVGNSFINKVDLYNLSNSNPNIILYESPDKISEIMLRSDIAISSGGSTLYELCACGTPALVFILADNQEFIVEKMSESGYIETIGWYNNIEADSFINKLKSLINNYNRRKRMVQNMQKLVDGHGAKRVAERILKELKKK